MLEAMVNLAVLSARFLASPPDVIHVQYLAMLRWPLPLDLWFLKLCRWRGSKIVLTVHDLLPHDTGKKYHDVFYGLYAMADRIICHSDSIRARLGTEFDVQEEKVWVIPHGPFFYDLPDTGPEDVLRRFEVEPGERVVLWQGIIFPYKGIDLLLDAWQEVEASVADVCLVIAGTGAPDLLEEIRGQIARLGLKRVRLHPRFISPEELVAIYRVAEIVVYPYRAITTSGALATGLALGKAIVASDLPVFRELLTHGENALLVKPEDAAALANALVELARNPQLGARLVEKVRKMSFGERSWGAIAMKTVACYESF
jgi:glycosyltransferase involved in cell wall biosynthesis